MPNNKNIDKSRSIIFKMSPSMNPMNIGTTPKNTSAMYLGLIAFLLITYIYIERVSFDTL